MFINRVTANEAARNAHAIGVAPEVIFFDAHRWPGGQRVPGGLSRLHQRRFWRSRRSSPTPSALYRRVHAGPRLQQTKTIFDMIEEHIEQGRELGSHFPPTCPGSMHRYGQAKAAFIASGLDLVPCFNDPMPGNFLIGADRPRRSRCG